MTLLTIAIPTFNRSKLLDLCLQKIYEEIQMLDEYEHGLVKIYVSDNASSDDTSEIISSHLLKAEVEFDVICNKENIGAERNLIQCYRSAQTPYVWIFGDDDIIVPGGLRKVLHILQNTQVDIVYVNNHWFIGEYSWGKAKVEKNHFIEYQSSLSFVRRTNIMLTFISAFIVRTGVNLELSADLTGGSRLPQLGWLLPLLQDGKNFVVIEDVVVAAKGSNSGGYSLVEVFGYNLKNITENIFKDSPELSKTIQNGTIVNFFPGFIIKARKGMNRFADKNMEAGLREVFGDNWRYYLFIYPLFRLPVSALNAYSKLMGIGRRLFYELLV